MRQTISFILLILCATSGINIVAQSDISMVTHWYNRAGYNPAFIARTDYFYAFANARHQWNGVDGAPNVVNLQLSEYIHNLRSAFGLSCVSDNVGVTRSSNPMLTYAYRIANDNDWSLSLGLSAGVFIRSIDGTLYDAEIVNDPLLHYDKEEYFHPDANAGIEFLSEYFILGISSTHLFSIGKPDNLFLNANHRYGYAIYKNNNLNLFFYKVGLQVVNRNDLTVVEGNLSVRLKHPTGLLQGPRELFDFGLTYRSTRQMTFLIGLTLSADFRIGYAYDHSFAPGFNRNGTHEIMLEYRIFNRIASTRLQCGKDLFWYH